MLQIANLGLRFVLELVALAAVGYWGFASFSNLALRLLCGIGLPLLLATIWGVFRVPGDGGPPVVEVGGAVRLMIEALVFGTAVALLVAAGEGGLAATLALVLVLHYIADAQRVLWLLGLR